MSWLERKEVTKSKSGRFVSKVRSVCGSGILYGGKNVQL